MKSYTFEQYLDVNCQLSKPDRGMLYSIVSLTEGRACIGCGFFAGGSCKSYQELTSAFQGIGPDLGDVASSGMGRPAKFHRRTEGSLPPEPLGKTRGVQPSATSTVSPITYTETVKEEAARTGVSISEVRRRRRDTANANSQLEV